MRYPTITLVFLLGLLVESSFAATCYSYDGREHINQQICEGSRQCCGEQATCTENRLCHNPGEEDGVLVRGPCAENPWDPEKCAAICLYDEFLNGQRKFPRARVCDNGSYCCDNDSLCCQQGRGVFLDKKGDIVSASSSIQTSTSTSMTSSTSPSASQTSASSSESDSDDGLSTGAKAGIGVGVALAALVAIAGIISWWIMKKRRAARDTPLAPPGQYFDQAPGYPPAYQQQQQHYQQQAYPIKEGHRASFEQPAHELPPSNPPAEMDGGSAPQK